MHFFCRAQAVSRRIRACCFPCGEQPHRRAQGETRALALEDRSRKDRRVRAPAGLFHSSALRRPLSLVLSNHCTLFRGTRHHQWRSRARVCSVACNNAGTEPASASTFTRHADTVNYSTLSFRHHRTYHRRGTISHSSTRDDAAPTGSLAPAGSCARADRGAEHLALCCSSQCHHRQRRLGEISGCHKRLHSCSPLQSSGCSCSASTLIRSPSTQPSTCATRRCPSYTGDWGGHNLRIPLILTLLPCLDMTWSRVPPSTAQLVDW